TVISFFPDQAPAVVTENLAALKVKHLLTMAVGHEKDSILLLEQSPAGTPWAKTFLSLPVVEKPGTRFMYNSGASFMLSAIVQKATGQTAHDYLKRKLFDPLNITGSTWTTNPDGVNMGASHLRLRTEDMAKFGQFFLQRGKWKGKQLLSKEWIISASSKQIESGKNDSSWAYGYGYQFWLNPPGGFRADGAFGQYTMIFPHQDAVVTITSESMSTKSTMQLVWDHLLPEMNGKASSLPENHSVSGMLKEKLNTLAYEPPKMSASSPLANTLSGREYLLNENPFNAKTVSFSFIDNKCVFTLKEDSKPNIVINNGINHWIREGNYKPSAHSLFSLRRIDFDSIVAASATWIDEKTLLLTWRFIETVHSDSLMCLFDGDQVNIRLLFSVAQMQGKPDDRPGISGRLIG
ncbi:MAG: serine hydrolase, partial [Marivirga sp.]|nr:serine hydrolase [Marivirga sp.]